MHWQCWSNKHADFAKPLASPLRFSWGMRQCRRSREDSKDLKVEFIHLVHMIGTNVTFYIVLRELELESRSITLKTGLSSKILPNWLISGIRWLVNHEILWPPLASRPVFCLQRLNSRRMKMEEGLTNVDLLRPKKLCTVLCTEPGGWSVEFPSQVMWRLFDQILKLSVVPIKFGID